MNCVIELVILHLFGVVLMESHFIKLTYPNPKPEDGFRHMVKDETTGYIFVAGVNKIIKLSENFTVDQAIATGPKDDSQDCLPIELSFCDSKKPMKSYSKALMIDYVGKRLIACSSLFQGSCTKYLLSDITKFDDDDSKYQYVVANNATATTVAFIAPGPSFENEIPPPNVMYVGTTYTTTGIRLVREDIPAFSSRKLNTFMISKKDIFHSTSKVIDAMQRWSFYVNYIYGFSSGKFSYMATVQRASTQSEKYITKLIRVCQDDKKFYSYTEVELVCEFNGAKYNLLQAARVAKPGKLLAEALFITTKNDVLFATFSIGKAGSTEALNDTAVCFYPLKKISEMFTKNIKNCFEGIGNTGPDHIVTREPCTKGAEAMVKEITLDYCGKWEVNQPIDGFEPIKATAALGLKTTVSSITVTVTHDYTIAFIGTQNGHILKVAIESQTLAHMYEDLVVEPGARIHEDMVFDMDEKHLIIMTNKKLYKLALQDCSQYQSCGECQGANDPFCGWCSLEDKCSLREQCQDHESALRWLGYKGETCTNITSVYPDKLQKDNKYSRTTTLTLNISNLPMSAGPFKCQFSAGRTILHTKANRTSSNTVTCETPPPNTIPQFPVDQDYINMNLSVVINNTLFVTTNFIFFDCEVHSDDACYKCSLSKFNCTWCIKNHLCTHYPLQDCSETDKFVAASNSVGFLHEHTVGPKKCPRIETSSNRILVPSGNPKKVTLFVYNLKDFQIPLYCYFSIGSGKFVPARLISFSEQEKVLECDPLEFSYLENTKSWNVPFKIVWGSKDLRKSLDNPGPVQVTIFKCEMMGSSCGDCLVIPTEYNCGWCGTECTTNKVCEKRQELWLHSTSTCPNPKIISISPLSGPKMGGTELTIIGENLGRTYPDIVSYVDVAGIPCSPDREKYDPPSRIVCETGKYFEDFLPRGHVRVTVNGQYLAESKQIFSYVAPNITSISPTQGSQSGGTVITISGHDVNAGTNIVIEIDGVPCIVTRKLPEQLICVTEASNKTKIGKLRVTFDKHIIDSNLTFTFIDDPIIRDARPRKTIISGGLPVNVTGSRLNIIQKPKLVIWGENGEAFEGDCLRATTTEEMICWTPLLDIDMLNRRKRSEDSMRTPSINLKFGFRLDNVKKYEVFGNISVYPDPQFELFDPSTKLYQGKTNDFLSIGGKYLTDTAFDHTQVAVQIGKDNCTVKSIQYLLSCKPPKSEPASINGGQHPEVIVRVGKNLTFTLGTLMYEQDAFDLPVMYIILIACGGGLLLLIVIIVIIMYRLKSKKNDSMMKKMQNQMDNLELKVAKECKEAFAELQTDMTELTSDLYGQVAIPFWNYQTYCMRVLFPQDNTADHPVIKDLEVDYRRRDSVEKGLALFSQLINNKTFLLTFIRTLEGHKNFTMKDKVNVASLISVALQTKMEYSTDILKTLLSDLIERSIDGKKEPKLLFRRNESVAEKMLTNWFTFLLYKFLKEVAGEPLFMLYQAIKQQVAKGPVDSATSEARYSLSEDKLIRQQIEYKQMTIYVQDMEQYQGAHPVKVLDCDTVSQVKEKILDAIYKNAPFSSRPIKDDVDLVLFDPSSTEWSSGTKGRLILQDDDHTTKQDGEYRRINTLFHYKVNDGAYMTLVSKQPQFNQSSLNSSEKSGSKFYDNFPFSTRSPSLNRTVTPQNVALEMEIAGVNKFYHLVRPHESENFNNKEGTDRGSKMVSEIYLTRLLATKGTLQQFVDDLFERIFSIAHRGNALPLAIKYMFDFLDDQALLHNIQDQEVVYTWKSNSLPLRFWVNVIKNPNFVFDIYKSNIVDSCLSVVAQTFMDSCSQSPHRLGKDSPSSKLLFAKDIPKFKKWVERYYQDITMMPAISDQDMTAMMTEESRIHQDEFNTTAALYELYKYVIKYNEELWQALEEDEFAKKNRLQFKLEQVRLAMDMDKEVYC